jgi:Fic family protein
MPGTWTTYTWQSDPTLYAPRKFKRACRYAAFVPDRLADLTVTVDGPLAGLVSEAEQAIGALNENANPALLPLSRLLLRTESIASSKVEGLQLGVRELARAEVRLETGRIPGPTALEVLSNIDAMMIAVDDAAIAKSFRASDIVAIHKRLMERTEHHRIAGRIRARQNWIGGNDHTPCGADFVPPPPTEVKRLLTDLCAAINDDLLPPLVQAALVHAQFETIHPFDDGNGRTARALVQVVLRRRGLAPAYVPPISIALAASKARYIGGLTSFRGDDISVWIEYFASAAARAANLATAYLGAAARLGEQWRAQLAALPDAPRAGAAAWAILDALPAYPMITASGAAATTGRARAAVYPAIEQLEAAGVLIPVSEARRNQAWEVAGMLNLVEGLESGEFPRGVRNRR